MLGHHVPFTYCRTLQDNLPCSKILDCYFERLPVRKWLDESYSAEELEKILKPPEPKLSTILDHVKQAQERMKQSEKSTPHPGPSDLKTLR